MSTDNSSLPSVGDTKARWEQLTSADAPVASSTPSHTFDNSSTTTHSAPAQPETIAISHPQPKRPPKPPPKAPPKPSHLSSTNGSGTGTPRNDSASSNLSASSLGIRLASARLSENPEADSQDSTRQSSLQSPAIIHSSPRITESSTPLGSPSLGPMPPPPPRSRSPSRALTAESTKERLARSPIPPPPRSVTPVDNSVQQNGDTRLRSPAPPPPRARTPADPSRALDTPRSPARSPATADSRTRSPAPPPPRSRQLGSTPEFTRGARTPSEELPELDLSTTLLPPAPPAASQLAHPLVAPSAAPPMLPPRPQELPPRPLEPPRHLSAVSVPQMTPQPPTPPTYGYFPPPPPALPPRPSFSSTASSATISSTVSVHGNSDSDDTSIRPPLRQTTSSSTESHISASPDSSQASHRRPLYEGAIHELATKGDIRSTLVVGDMCVVSSAGTTIAYNPETGATLWSISHQETRVTAISKVGHDQLWLGTRDGELWEVVASSGVIVRKRANIHMNAVVSIFLGKEGIWSLSEDGKICTWLLTDGVGAAKGGLTDTPVVHRVTPNFKAWCIAGSTLWIGRTRQLHVYNPSATSSSFLLTSRPITAAISQPGKLVGEFTCATHLSTHPDMVFFGHDDGYITVYSKAAMAVVEDINVSMYKITALCGVEGLLWIGLNNGTILVCDVNQYPWKVRKEWKAHEGAVTRIQYRAEEQTTDSAPVISCGATETVVKLWDGLLKHDWIDMQLSQHDEEFSVFNDAKVQIITWNVGAAKTASLGPSAVNGLVSALNDDNNPADIIVFGFQELVDLDNKSLTAKTMFQSKKKNRQESVAVSGNISHQYKMWQDRLDSLLGEVNSERYVLLHSDNMVGLFTCLFVKSSMQRRVSNVKSSEIKTGLGGLHGNKGGLAVRLIVDDSSLCFVNCHLAAGQSSVLQRNSDVNTILETDCTHEEDNVALDDKGIFVNRGDGTKILDHELCFISGDMNYRVNKHRQIAMKAIQDGDLEGLLESDQLTVQLKRNPALRLRAFQEPPITFFPTYKFDVNSDQYDSGPKQRVPAWCDRIFYRGGDRVKSLSYTSINEVKASDHRPVSAVFSIKLKTIDSKRRQLVYLQALESWQEYLERGSH